MDSDPELAPCCRVPCKFYGRFPSEPCWGPVRAEDIAITKGYFCEKGQHIIEGEPIPSVLWLFGICPTHRTPVQPAEQEQFIHLCRGHQLVTEGFSYVPKASAENHPDLGKANGGLL
jgi:hypothetical protein